MSMNKDGIRLHKSNFSAIGQQIQPMLESGDCYRLIIKPWKDKRSLSQNALLWMWNGDVASAVNRHADSKLTEEDLHEFMKDMFCPAKPVPNIQLNIWNGDTVQLPSRYIIATVEELDSQLWTVNSIKPNTDNTVSLIVAEYSDAIYQ